MNKITKTIAMVTALMISVVTINTNASATLFVRPEPYRVPEARQEITASFDVLKGTHSKDELVKALSRPGYDRFLPYVDTFLYVEKMYGTNALYMLSTLGLESGWGKYTTGKNNIAGWTGRTGYMDFDSIDECIVHVGRSIATSYKKAVGSKLADVCWRYCPMDMYLGRIMDIMVTLDNRMR